VTFGTDTTLTAYGSSTAQLVTFSGDVTGGTHSLTLGTVSTAPTNVSFGGTVSGITVLDVSGATAVNTSSVTTTGTQTYTGDVTFGTDTTLTAYGSSTAQLVTFSGDVTGGTHSLTLGTVNTVPTNVSFGGTVSGITVLDVSGATAINTSSVTTTGTQTYTGDVTFGTDTTLTAYGSSTAQLVTFSGNVTGGTHSLTLGTVSTAPTNVSFGGTVSGITTLSVSGTTGIASGKTVTTSDVQTYAGDVTNGGTINVPSVATGDAAALFKSAYTGNNGSYLTGSTTTNPYIDFYGDVSMGTFNANGDVVRFCGTGDQAFVPGSTNSYNNISVTNTSGTISIADGNAFVQDTTAGTYIFEVADGAKVTVGTGKFTADTLSVEGAGTFTQTGDNSGSDSGVTYLQSVLNITGTGSVTWDSGISGGYLTLGGCSSTGTVAFNHKNVTITGSATLTGVVFYDLYIPDGVTVTNGGEITVIRNFTLSDADSDTQNGTYTPGSGILYLGGMASSGVASADGTVSDNSTTVQSLGTVVINDNSQTAAKTAATALEIAALTVTDGTLDLATNNAALTVTGTAVNDGTITGSSSASSPAALTFTGKYSGSGTLTATKGTTYFKGDADLSGTAFTANNGTVEFSGSGTSGQTLTLGSSDTTFNTLEINTTGTSFTLADGTGKLTAATLSDAAGGTENIIFNASVSVTNGTTFNTTGTVTLGNASDDTCAFTGGVVHTAGDTNFAGTVTASDKDVSFAVAVLTADTVINTGSGSGNILFGSAVSGSGCALTLTAGTGNVELKGQVGAVGSSLGALTINSAYNVAGDNVSAGNPSVDTGTIYAASLTQSAGTGTTMLGVVTLTGAMDLTAKGVGIIGDGTITTASSVSLTGGSVDLNGTVTADNGFSSTGTTFDNTGAIITTTGTDLTINHTGAVTVGAALSSGAGAIDIDSASTLSITDTIDTTTGNVTVDSTDLATLDSAADITTTTGNVTFGADKTGTLSTAGDVTTEGVTADTSGAVTFTNDVTLTGPVTITTDNNSSTGGAVTFDSTVDSDSTARALTIEAGTGAVEFTGAVGTTALASLTLTDAGALTFDDALTVTGALTQTKAATGATTFGGSTAAAATSVGSADLNGTSYTLYGTFTTTNGGMTVTNSDVFLTEEDADITVYSGSDFTQDGSGLSQLAGGITTSGSGAITFASDVYLYGDGGTDSAMTFGGGSGEITLTDGSSGYRDLHIAADSGKTVTIGSPLKAQNVALYDGTVTLGANCSSITTTEDLVLLNGTASSMYNDDVATDGSSGVDYLFAYKNSGRSDTGTETAAISLDADPSDTDDTHPYSAFPQTLPDGETSIGHTAYTGTVTGSSLNDNTITVGQNFYDNGVDLEGSSSWTLELPANDTATSAFAEAYNMAFAYCTVSCSDSGGTAWVAAGENCTNGGDNTNVAFSRPVLLENDTSEDRDTGTVTDSGWTTNLSGTYTVYDDVIRVEFVDSVSGDSLKIENSNNEIYKALSNITYDNDGSSTAFTGTYVDADCIESTGTADDGSDSAGDLSVFYIKAADTWNTDATGISAGQSDDDTTTSDGVTVHYDESTDRSGDHKNVVPYIDLPKALSGVYATLRDCHKNRIGNYDGEPSASDYDIDGDGTDDANTSAADGRFTAVADRASPVLIEAFTGQELHTAYDSSAGASSQPYYDAHNFIELRYSEPVDIGDMAAVPDDVTTVENQQADTSYSSDSVHGGAIENSSSGITSDGLVEISDGAITAGSTDGTDADIVHSLYRVFPLYAGADADIQTDRIRIGIAAYVDADDTSVTDTSGNSYKKWIGYIDSATEPSGTAVSIANSYITDLSVNANILDATAATASLTSHKLSAVTVNTAAADAASVTAAATTLYGSWDTSAPVFAPFRGVSDTWSSDLSEYEAVGTATDGSTTLDRIEFHLLDNTPKYTSSEAQWYSRVGWCNGSDSSTLKLSTSYAADIFGGSRPFTDSANQTSGGIRYASLYDAASSFKYTTDTDGTPSTDFADTTITGGAQGTLFLPSNSTYNETGSEDGLYFAVYFSDSILSLRTTFAVKYTQGTITDLAGNRLKTATIDTVDRTPPEFNMTVAPLGGDKLYVVVSKSVTDEFTYYEDSTTSEVLDTWEYIPKCLELFDSRTDAAATDIEIKDTPAELVFRNSDATGFILTTTENITLSDVENLYLRVNVSDTSLDPATGIGGSYVSYIQDETGNYVTNYDAHAVSDFAVNAVNPQYAYDNRLTDEEEDITSGLYEDGSWAVHDWNADQHNYGTLLTDHDIFVASELYDGTTDNTGGLPDYLTVYLSRSPDSSSVSTEYNDNNGNSDSDGRSVNDWRIWLPNVTSDIFKNLAPANNTQYVAFSDFEFPDQETDPNTVTFTLPVTTDTAYSSWQAGDQISFLFGINDSDGNPVTIIHSPEADDSSGSSYSGTSMPLYALRLKDSSDITSLDLWSFKLKDYSAQRGGVTILNNVINVNNGEKTVVEVKMPSSGNLNVIVMTLDGNIIKYLQHGRTSKGLHYYRWDGTNKAGNKVARGLYFIRVVGPDIDETRKVMCVKK
jgi:hypothetical protein